jgi:hypothetical protein
VKFRKKPLVVEAEQFWPEKKAWPKGVVRGATNGNYIIRTLEGPHIVSPGDWIVAGVKGERYPVKPDIFEATYERVEGDAMTSIETRLAKMKERAERAERIRDQALGDLALYKGYGSAFDIEDMARELERAKSRLAALEEVERAAMELVGDRGCDWKPLQEALARVREGKA